jgi:hypothetical protein
MAAKSASNSTVKFEGKWDIARKIWNRAMKERNNDAMACIDFLTGQALENSRVAKTNPNNNGYKFEIMAQRMSDAATYGINLAFGIDKAKA